MKKGDEGMAKHFSKKYRIRDELSITCNPKKLRQDACPDATSLHHCLKNKYGFSGKDPSI